jgi:hypothetical protein
MAILVMSLFVMACFSSILCNQVTVRKAKEEAIAMDFLTHYMENVKALPYNSVAPGLPINVLFNGANGAPNISIPPASAWVPINTLDYATFHPDLLWLTNRNPKLLVTIAANSGQVGKDINAKVAWDAPLGKGGRLQRQVDLLRMKDL